MSVPEGFEGFAQAITDRLGELTIEVAPDRLVEACAFLKHSGYERLSDVTAVDRYPAEPRFEVIYHIQSVSKNQRLRLKSLLGGDRPEIGSATAVWRSANWYEREIFDLFGIAFRNHPDLTRILMPEDWEGHPLRKDYPVTGTQV